MISILSLNSQDQTITGKVVDENGQGLPGVNIKLKGTTKGTSTDSKVASNLRFLTKEMLFWYFR
jgi:hypothetical protein